MRRTVSAAVDPECQLSQGEIDRLRPFVQPFPASGRLGDQLRWAKEVVEAGARARKLLQDYLATLPPARRRR